MLLGVDNSTKTRLDSSHVLSPSLWIAVYDPTLTLEKAFADGYTRMVLINANGMTAINLGLNFREAPGHAPAYDYQLSISTIPSTDLPCDVGTQGSTGRCSLSRFLQFPTFDREVSRQRCCPQRRGCTFARRLMVFSCLNSSLDIVQAGFSYRMIWARKPSSYLIILLCD
ncbi:hypothetical protein B0H67DRAFT_177949 [Lasiosphaeris hirsuta]|uniref:Uncharacterized protein n=1 Tax=Lasiosphaeris hirsuta TaxID=260670 RepID=A0AA40DYB6_9PEZI|nr:hypothetical protein B0H67DRAFT_177949 [Lasiosphaeris hirsuta]